MAKRFVDSDRWNKPFFRKLGAAGRDLWNYLHDHCDVAGVWEIDLETLNYFTGSTYKLEDLEAVMGDRIAHLPDNKILLVDFISFQYKQLSYDCKPHLSVIRRIEELKLTTDILTLIKGLPKGINTLQDKDKDKDKEKDKEKEEEKKSEFNSSLKSEARFLPDYDKFLEGLRTSGKITEIEFKKRIPQIINHFESYENFKIWANSIFNTKKFESIQLDEERQRYFNAALNNALVKGA